MITESFLNSCFSLLLNKKVNVKKSKVLYRDMLEILKFSEGKESLDIPIVIQNKLDCLEKICNMLINGKMIENILDSISFSEKFKPYQDFLDFKANEDLKSNEIEDIIKQVRIRKKLNSLFDNYDDLNNVLETIKDGSFDSIDDLIEDYETTVKKLYSNMTEHNRAIVISETASLDLVKDDYTTAVDMIKKKYDRTNKTPSGFPILDNDILVGGFDPSRLYIFGGGSGSGKSTLLNNLMFKSGCLEKNLLVDKQLIKNSKEVEKVYVYITLENTIEESLLRTYMPMFGKTMVQVLQEISSTKNAQDVIKKRIVGEFAKNNATIVMKYFPAMSISTVDIMGVVDDVIDEYGRESIAGLYIDYLDLLKTDTKYDVYRMELGHITLSLKTLAVAYNIPVITATQLGRTVYRISEATKLNIDQVSESIKKVEHADFIGLLAKDGVNDNIVHGKIGKNRSGKANVAIDFNVDFSKFLFKSATFISNISKQDDASKDQNSQKNGTMSFKGLGALA